MTRICKMQHKSEKIICPKCGGITRNITEYDINPSGAIKGFIAITAGIGEIIEDIKGDKSDRNKGSTRNLKRNKRRKREDKRKTKIFRPNDESNKRHYRKGTTKGI